MKLTDNQTEVLTRLRNGERLHYTTGINPLVWWSSGVRTANWNTVRALQRRGLIERVEKDWRGGFFRIKEAQS